MRTTEECLMCLQTQNWSKLNSILTDKNKCKELASDPIFSIFENNLVSEIKRIDNKDNDSATIVLTMIYNLNQKNRILALSSDCILKIAEFLFEKFPSEGYAKHLVDNKKAKEFLINLNNERKKNIEKTMISANLNIKIGDKNELDFSKSVMNSPQEIELYNSALKIFPNKLIYPNIALSVIIDPKILRFLDQKSKSFYFKSTIDLCIIDKSSFIPELFYELDSSWHDKPKQIENDKMKDSIFKKAGLTLHRLRKKENKEMQEIFEIYLKKHAS